MWDESDFSGGWADSENDRATDDKIHRAIEEYTLTEIARAVTDVALPEILDATDRCDGCQAQAYVVVCKPGVGAPLKFCGHHFARNEKKLLEAEFVVLSDERERINARPSPSANAD